MDIAKIIGQALIITILVGIYIIMWIAFMDDMRKSKCPNYCFWFGLAHIIALLFFVVWAFT